MTDRLTLELPADLAQLVRDKVSEGRFPSEGDVVLEALRVWAAQEEAAALRLKWVRRDIDEADAETDPPLTLKELGSQFDDAPQRPRHAGVDGPGFVFRDAAVADLRAIYQCFGADDPWTAANMVDEVCIHCRSLAEFPELGDLRNDIRPGLRTVVTLPQRIVIAYRVTDQTSVVLRVFFGGPYMDLFLYGNDSRR